MRRVEDVIFPSEVRFPAKESLGEGSLLRDAAMPAPFLQADGGGWGLVIGEAGLDEDLEYDGWLGENELLIVERSVDGKDDLGKVSGQGGPIVGDVAHDAEGDVVDDDGLVAPAPSPDGREVMNGWRVDVFGTRRFSPRLGAVARPRSSPTSGSCSTGLSRIAIARLGRSRTPLATRNRRSGAPPTSARRQGVRRRRRRSVDCSQAREDEGHENGLGGVHRAVDLRSGGGCVVYRDSPGGGGGRGSRSKA